MILSIIITIKKIQLINLKKKFLKRKLFKNLKKFVVEQVDAEKETSNVKAIITGETQKALLLQYDDGAEEVWTPKSIIHSKYESTKGVTQSFSIESWFLKKNNIIR